MRVVIETDGEALMETTTQIITTGRTPSDINEAKGNGTDQGGTRWLTHRIRTHGGKREMTRGPRRLDTQADVKVTNHLVILVLHMDGALIAATATNLGRTSKKGLAGAVTETTILGKMSVVLLSATHGNSKRKNEWLKWGLKRRRAERQLLRVRRRLHHRGLHLHRCLTVRSLDCSDCQKCRIAEMSTANQATKRRRWWT